MRCLEARDVCGHVVRLNDELSVLAIRIAPAAELDRHLTMCSSGRCLVPCEQAQSECGLHVRDIRESKAVSSVAQVTALNDLGAEPLVGVAGNAKMKESFWVRPGVTRVVRVGRAVAVS